MTNERNLGAVIFDFNGVLLWDNPLHEEAWRRFSAQLRGTPMSLDEMRTEVHGRTNRDILTYVIGHTPDEAELHELAEGKEGFYRRLALESGDAYHLAPGAVEFLDFLVAHNIPRAIATSSPASNVTFFIEQLNLLRWFDEADIIYDEGRYPGKPAPFIYLEAAGQLGLPPERCVVVEDAIRGIEAAYNAGAGAIVGVSSTTSAADLAALPGVDAVIPDLTRFPRELFGHLQPAQT